MPRYVHLFAPVSGSLADTSARGVRSRSSEPYMTFTTNADPPVGGLAVRPEARVLLLRQAASEQLVVVVVEV
ncbi:MAG: hypothetical protein Q8J63_01855, partial [Candidatus Aquicultor sp.]|nr:hypothetical protein [Candidatus Aquicultor sp.]